ncbi:hypothetical protein N5C70_18410 [Pseudomonas juntendi]|uniref:Uncharacterized protein n=1 Tax=Pseudomonas juntendi TaxID=2666183 RepID=A0ABD4YGM7_9PSED|nr:hypothetical protein [Pseudomonas juntendi]MDH0758666.1 hypothetical protein [Pseudomonas juntendi]MDH1920507.1 hypothetical protein [Pseudomonas juntendi]
MTKPTKKMQNNLTLKKNSGGCIAAQANASKTPALVETNSPERTSGASDLRYWEQEVKKLRDLATEERARFDQTCHSLLTQLHATQEQLEALWNKHDITSHERDHFKELFFYTLSKNLNFWLYKSLSINLTKNKERLEVDIHLKDTYISDERFEELRFKLIVVNGTAGLVFPPARPSEPTMIKNWTHDQLSKHEFCCLPAQGSSFENANYNTASLGTTDWLRVQDLFKKLDYYFENNSDTIPLSNNICEQFSAALKNTNNTLRNWPKILRYDQISLEESTDFDNYNALDISLKNALINDKVIDELRYTIATTYSSRELPHEHPRLEFPESCKGLVDNWYAETQDDRGARLELRFAHPNAMDIEVWHKLSTKDQILVATLLSGAERQLSELEIKPELSGLETAAWHEVAKTMRKALGDYTLNSKRGKGLRI